MKEPGPDHPIHIAPHHGRIRVRLAGTLLAETEAALVLTEAAYLPVLYIPRGDARWEHFAASTRRSHCPYKGDASYFSLTTPDATRPDAVWSYAEPYPAVAAIAGYLAFYPDRVDPIEGI
ncbi:DUF427 domain-containing protein [Methylobacterium sp.]|jgi:uncharacterized protein (DUF427 family)|uniref:DUF427 domain-containing protein n=1 Tax=Methylobacterium sp. TaxID=409 RepID=UPI00262A9E36|nr:DUF427 domain-containing protein [Methylobacterium sp.]MDB5647649.1 hypothetical protein [Methylobacterium sp.]